MTLLTKEIAGQLLIQQSENIRKDEQYDEWVYYGITPSVDLTIPSIYTSIAPDAFTYSDEFGSVRTVVIPDSVTSIGEKAFYDTFLKEGVVIPDSVTSIGHDAFNYCRLSSIKLPEGLTKIGDSVFYFNNLTSVVIPDSVTSIGEYAFADNLLTTVAIPDSVTSIGENAFKYNELSSVKIADSVSYIDEGAFEQNQLTTVAIPDSVTSIGENAFKNNKLTSVEIPDSVSYIAEGAFEDNSLYEVLLPFSFEDNIPYNAFDLGIKFNFRDEVIPDAIAAFTAKKVSKVKGFDADAGYSVEGADGGSFAIASNKKDLKQLMKSDADVVYYEKKGRLYLNENGEEKGWGAKKVGGLIAKFKSKPELSADNFDGLSAHSDAVTGGGGSKALKGVIKDGKIDGYVFDRDELAEELNVMNKGGTFSDIELDAASLALLFGQGGEQQQGASTNT